MYHPYFRGKLNELITVRETAGLMAACNFVPIIEPVKEALSGLKRTLDAVVEVNGKAVVIINPFHGDFSGDGQSISELLQRHYKSQSGISAGVLLKGDMTATEAMALCVSHKDCSPAIIHAGFTDAKGLFGNSGVQLDEALHIFFEPNCGMLYRKHFRNATQRVLIRDGFQRRKNRDHPEIELFSDLHETFEMEQMTGFGDFLIVGDDYAEMGGPAYAVAIHITFIDPDNDSAMYVYHFVSDSKDTPKDPAGKFGEALAKMIRTLGQPGSSKILETNAIKEFRELYTRKHFPGLGYIKKLSMQHHVETLAARFPAKLK
jgi:hypothetical protein